MIPVRITDLNYGGHLGNEMILSIAQEARAQWLETLGWTELDCGDHGMIMADAAISFKGEAFYGDVMKVELFSDQIGSKSFDFVYRISIQKEGGARPVAHLKTGMVSFDYRTRQICSMNNELTAALSFY